MNPYRKYHSSKDLKLKSNPQLKLIGCDPFVNLKLTKKNPAILKPICHRRLVSENSLNSIEKKIVPRVSENFMYQVPKSLQSPRLSPDSFLRLNPDLKKINLKLPTKVVDVKTPRINKYEVGRDQAKSCMFIDCMIGKNKGNFLVNKLDAANKNLDFSFGNS